MAGTMRTRAQSKPHSLAKQHSIDDELAQNGNSKVGLESKISTAQSVYPSAHLKPDRTFVEAFFLAFRSLSHGIVCWRSSSNTQTVE